MRKSQYVENSVKYAPGVVLEAFKANLKSNNDIKYQYFGTETGVLFTYPASTASDCHDYDPRFR